MDTVKKLEFDPYHVLELTSPCSDSEIDKAFKKSALKWHPDKAIRNGISKEESERRFGQIYQAYQFLKDEALRDAFDLDVARKKQRKTFEEERRSTSSARRQGLEDKLRAKEEAFEKRRNKVPRANDPFSLDKELERLKKEGAAYLAAMAEKERRQDKSRIRDTVPLNLNGDHSIYHITADKLQELEDAELAGL